MTEQSNVQEAGASAPAAGPNQKVALLLLDVGAPCGPADAQAFLKRLYSDARMLRSPFGTELQKLFAGLLARKRAAALRQALESVGGKAPEAEGLMRLARQLAERLERAGSRRFVPFVATRHGVPSIQDAVAAAKAEGCERLLGLWSRPIASQASESARVQLALVAQEDQGLDVSIIDHWADAPELRPAWAALVKAAPAEVAQAERAAVHLLFALPGQPLAGSVDPALEAARTLARAAIEDAGVTCDWSVAYQSGVDPRAELLPSIEEELARLGRERRPVAVLPLAHGCESLATRWELDQVLAAHARGQGVPHFSRVPCPAEHEGFLAALAALAQRHLGQMDELRSARG